MVTLSCARGDDQEARTVMLSCAHGDDQMVRLALCAR